MHDRIHPTRRRVPAVGAVLAAGLAIAGCGSSNKPNSGTNRGLASSSRDALIRYADCMRSHGVTNFPDPDSSGNISFSGSGSGPDPQSPLFQAAEKTCAKLRPGGNPAATDSATAARLQQFLAAATCMRAHGIPDFPDPRTGVALGRDSSHPVPGTTVTQDGVSFVIPASINVQSPMFTHAASVCHLSELFGVPPGPAPSA